MAHVQLIILRLILMLIMNVDTSLPVHFQYPVGQKRVQTR